MIRLHHCPQTRSMRTLWLLIELGVTFEVVEHAFGKNLRSSEYLRVSLSGRIPALEIDGDRMIESGAITEYLCEIFPKPGLGRLPGERERRDWLIWVHFAETISQHAAALTQQHVALYDPAMRSPIVTKLEAARIGKCFGALEAALSDGREYLLTGGFSAADISVGQAVYMARYFTRLDGFDRLAQWYARITARPGFKEALPERGTELYAQEFYEVWEG